MNRSLNVFPFKSCRRCPIFSSFCLTDIFIRLFFLKHVALAICKLKNVFHFVMGIKNLLFKRENFLFVGEFI